MLFSRPLQIAASLFVTVNLSPAQTDSPTPPAEVTTITVGDRPLKIPAPDGFVRCDGIDADWDRLTTSVLPPNNHMQVTFGTPADQEAIRKGGPTEYSRNFNVQSIRSLETQEIGEKTFAGLRQNMKKELLAMRDKIEADVQKLVKQGNREVSEHYGVDAALSISDVAMLGFFEESDTAIGFTMAMKLGAANGQGGREESRAVVAAIMTPVNGRLVNLYSTGPYKTEADQKEVERSVMAWRDAIVAANPRVKGPAVGIDSERAIRTGIIGGAIGAMVMLFQLFKRKSTSTAIQ